MKRVFSKIGGYSLKKLGYGHVIDAVKNFDKNKIDIDFLLSIQERGEFNELRSALQNSKAQINQDVMALIQSNFKRSGFFVEFGAGNGVDGSNTFMLEEHYGWTGILAEPARLWHADLKKNRHCNIDLGCVFSSTGLKVEFRESVGGYLSGVVATANDIKGPVDESGRYEVVTISLNDLLEKYSAPRFIEFLSADTEGSEFEILKSLDFEKYTFGFICIEHNRAPIREDIRELLCGKGYALLDSPFGFEDWFVSCEQS